ncbi:hypothetical protein [Amycolatopsis methanolica]|uniref:hypothetical protein n=1 Tax=Amycolatopsis methanolica TaxID=1814 RepID=UPI0003A2361B|nr:hypothetical protein [Amycolatopsis methanolica]
MIAVWPDDPTDVFPVARREPTVPFLTIWQRESGEVPVPDSAGGQHHGRADDHVSVNSFYEERGAWPPRPPAVRDTPERRGLWARLVAALRRGRPVPPAQPVVYRCTNKPPGSTHYYREAAPGRWELALTPTFDIPVPIEERTRAEIEARGHMLVPISGGQPRG